MPTDRAALHTRILMFLALLSGCCALAYEILYMRALTTLLGDMLYVHAALLSTFLVGIGAGAKLARWGVRWLWAIELLTGAYALALPPLARELAGRRWMADIAADPTGTTAATIALLVVPSLLVGFSVPLFSAYIKSRDAGRLSFQGVYIAYNLGALVSVLAVEFLLVRHLGVTLALAAIGAINVLNGVVLLVLREAPHVLPAAPPRRFPARVVLALALASFVSAAFQMFFLKLTYLVFGPHRENFAVALSVTMLGMFLGAWLASRVRVEFATFTALVPLVLGLTYACFTPLVRLFQASQPIQAGSEALLLAHKLGIGALFALGPMVLFGATIPALMRTEQEVVGESGHLLWVSSVANAAGYLAWVGLGHPWLSAGTVLVLIALGALLASLLAVSFRWSRPQLAWGTLGVVAVAAMLVTWDDRRLYFAQWLDDLDPGDEVRQFKSGPESATLLVEPDEVWLTYNGHASIWVHENGIVTVSEAISGVIPALSAPTFERALVLGLGTGITAGATAAVFERTDVVEINNAFYEMMPHLAYANLDIGNNPGVTRYLNDGRSFLLGREGAYDAIVNSIPAPTYYSASKIYTREFYQRVARALKPDGVFCTWLAVPNMSAEGVEAILSALARNFRYCDLRLMGPSYYSSTCSNAPLRVRGFDDLPARLDLIDLLQQGLPEFDLAEYFDDIRLSPNLFEHEVPHVAEENTDDHPVLEFMVVRNFQLGRMGGDPFVGHQERYNIDPVRAEEVTDRERFLRRAAVHRALDSGYYENFVPWIEAAAPLHAGSE